MSEKTEIVPFEPNQIRQSVDRFSGELVQYLDYLGLPAENVLVDVAERRKVIANLPAVTEEIAPARRSGSLYISKFIAACGVGLFDAALNYLWNETVSNVRSKVARFDLEYFYDSVVTDPKRRATLKTEDDLKKIEEWELIRGCLVTGIITEIGFKHLDYIRDMRNYASAAHPNHNSLSGLQLVSWLETCIREVLSREPEGPVIEVRRLLLSLREETLTRDDIPPIATSLASLPDDLSVSLLRTTFGMYTDPKTSPNTRANISFISPALWASSGQEARHEIGLKHAVFSANGEIARKKLASDFLQRVEGLSYLPPDTLAVEVKNALDGLWSAHNGYNNFHNEPAFARFLRAYVPETGLVPPSVEVQYTKTLLMCKIGNGYGVSRQAEPFYDELLGRFSDTHFKIVLKLIGSDREVQSRLQFSSCRTNLRSLADEISSRTNNGLIRGGLRLIAEAEPDLIGTIWLTGEFKRAMSALKALDS
jgi:hypothetical protein